MNKAIENNSKPSLMSLVQLFVCAAALMSFGGYLYVWTHDLTSKDSDFFTSSVTALSTPFGFIVALLWRTLHTTAKRAILSINQLAQPICKRVLSSHWYHFAAVVLFSYTTVTSTSIISQSLAVLALIASLFQLSRVWRGN